MLITLVNFRKDGFKKEKPSHKICKDCKEEKTSNNFYKEVTNKDCLANRCKECERKRVHKKKEDEISKGFFNW